MDVLFAVAVVAGLILALLSLLRLAWRAETTAKAQRDDALEALETERRIVDATRQTPDPPSARDWLRRFGAARADPDQR
ncbi:hypothetical protein [Pseudogemmobacter bohemicus]|uniref:hypothetical protein n=1 Tax=Pseudogemmobacter bohemicus TaxID=2250708 RepID=UPI000DD459E9|nr:hypothetical protein [Pseudogemmobacter bohemicus]